MKHSFAFIEKKVEQELIWLYNQSSADLGERSNWIDARDYKYMGSSAWKDPFSEKHMAAVSKKHLYETALLSIPALHQQILYATFGSYKTTYYFNNSAPANDTDRQKYIYLYKFFLDLAPSAILLSDLAPDELNSICKTAAKETIHTAHNLYNIKIKAQKEYKLSIINYHNASYRKQ